MALMTINIGLETTNDPSYKDIFASPPNPSDKITAKLASTTGTFLPGQCFSLLTIDNDGQVFQAVADKTAFLALQKQAAILLNAVTQAGDEVYASLQTKGSFIQDKLTPNDIPPGVYGDIIIEKGAL